MLGAMIWNIKHNQIQKWPRLFRHCGDLFSKERYGEAIDLLERHVPNKSSPNKSVWSWLGAAYYDEADYCDVLKYFEIAVEEYHKDVRSRTLLACSLLHLNKPEHARQQFKDAISRANTADLRELLTMWYCASEQAGDWSAAAYGYELLLRDNPDDLDIVHSYALLLAAAPDPTVRNGHKSIMYAQRVCESQSWSDWQSISVLAAAHAKKALNIAPKEERGTREQRLDEYRKGKPYRMPVPSHRSSDGA
jgi:tetratricopeptide (TPR) repeat protein